MDFELYKNTSIRMVDEDGEEHHFVPNQRRVNTLTMEEAAINWVGEIKLPTVGLAYNLHILDVEQRNVYEVIVSTDMDPPQVVMKMFRFRERRLVPVVPVVPVVNPILRSSSTPSTLETDSDIEMSSPLTSVPSSATTSQTIDTNRFEVENAICDEVENYAARIPRDLARRANDLDPSVMPAATGANQALTTIPSVSRHRFVRNWQEELLWVRKVVEAGYNALSYGVGDLLQVYSPWLTREQNITIRMFYIVFPQMVIYMPGTLSTQLHLQEAEQRYREGGREGSID